MYKVKQCRYGKMLFNENDNTVGKCLDEYGEWSEPEPLLFSQIVRPNDVVVEAGANIGAHSVPLSKMVGEDGRLYVFEPQRIVFQMLCANLALNELLNVRAFHAALGNKNEITEFPYYDPRNPNNFGAATFYDLGKFPSESVTVRTLDSYALDRVDFIKADVEGYEPMVLDGAKQTIERHRPVLYLEYLNHHTLDSSGEIISRLKHLNYSFWYYICPAYNPQNFSKNPDNFLQGVWSFDLLCVPSEKAVVTGMQNALTERGYCDDPDAWRSVRFEWKI
ncbi:FkbM family methyltransferase [Paraburkholderia dinghuensis]|uniref:FkbM family methyltransferase n=1 Tax=Paraburkholderia dinghuensis TaxID=2305225 RepID=A0A3N6NJT8_9BURK|nr:FkbM family methyltransferase [Paraburkholderia dinghuensis]RQH09147.1 FkbM family methyltransferase [Paraburkholderia dinghuensis]